mgnify:CR=1 FL=1
MMELVWAGSNQGQLRDYLVAWCAREIWGNPARDFGNCKAMGVLDDGRLIAVMVFHNWEPTAEVIEISGAATSKRWLSRKVLHRMFAYPFEEVGAQTVVMRVSPKDKALKRMLEAYGFSCYKLPRLRGRYEDELVFTLTDDAWRNNGFHTKGYIDGQGIRARSA